MKDFLCSFERKQDSLLSHHNGTSLILPSTLAIQATLTLSNFENLSQDLLLQGYALGILESQKAYFVAHFALQAHTYQCFFFSQDLLPKHCKEAFLDLLLPLQLCTQPTCLLFVYAQSYAFVFSQNQQIFYYKAFQDLQDLQIAIEYVKTAFDRPTPEVHCLCYHSNLPPLPHLKPYTLLFCKDFFFSFPPCIPFAFNASCTLLPYRPKLPKKWIWLNIIASLLLLLLPLGFYGYQLILERDLHSLQSQVLILQTQSKQHENSLQQTQSLLQTLQTLQQENTQMAYTLHHRFQNTSSLNKLLEILQNAQEQKLHIHSFDFLAPTQLKLTLSSNDAKAFFAFKQRLPYQTLLREQNQHIYHIEIILQ